MRPNFVRFILRSYLTAVAWWLLTLYLFTLPGSAFPKADWLDQWHADKLVHAMLFFVLVWLFYQAGSQQESPSKKLALIIVAAIVYGIAIEYMQKYWIPNRSFDLGDILADATGCLLVPLALRLNTMRLKQCRE
jgi:VanZ family protein